MARIRTIKPEFWESPDTAAASPRARLLYIAMWNWADDYGVGKWTERELLAFAFPNDHDVTVEDFPSLVKEVADCFGTTFYVNRGRRYYAIPAWDKHQKTERRAQGKYPTPDDADSTPDQAFSSAAESVGSSAVVLGSSSLGKGTGNRGTGEQGSGNRGTVAPVARASMFDVAYESWPKKVDRKDAAAKWPRAVKEFGGSESDLVEIVRTHGAAYAAHREKQFIPSLLVWLNKGRWDSELPTAEESKRSGYQTNTEQNLAYLASLRAEESGLLEIEGAA